MHEVKSELERFKKLLAPAEKDFTAACLYRMGKMTHLKDGLDETIKSFLEELIDVPADILELACRQWYRNNKFFPTLSELLEIIQEPLFQRRKIFARLQTLLNVADNPAPGELVTEDWVQEVLVQGSA